MHINVVILHPVLPHDGKDNIISFIPILSIDGEAAVFQNVLCDIFSHGHVVGVRTRTLVVRVLVLLDGRVPVRHEGDRACAHVLPKDVKEHGCTTSRDVALTVPVAGVHDIALYETVTVEGASIDTRAHVHDMKNFLVHLKTPSPCNCPSRTRTWRCTHGTSDP